jgi:NAD(P)-dependent dehydrogenase (short-subunit alcohol dehydrogenase family)
MSEISKAVLITGCSTGIGRTTAEHLARGGLTVYATARRPESIEDLTGAGCRTLALDVTDEESMAAAVAAVEEAEGAVGALVNNAGYSQNGAVETVALEDVRRQFETNVFGLLRMCQLVLPGMRRQAHGRIVNVSSMGGKLTFPGGGAYHATKHAVEALSDAMRFEVRGFGVHVSVIEPGLIKTNFAETSVGSVSHEDGPYAEFNTAVAAATAGAYDGPLAKLGGGPEAVAKVIEKAITAARPRTRYKVTASARLLMAQRSLLPDRAWDAVVGTSFPRPGRSSRKHSGRPSAHGRN